MTARTMSTVARTYRAAIQIGNDYVTLEETITLPLDATDDDITAAVALGLRIHAAQHDAFATHITTLHADAAAAPVPALTLRDPDAPASAKQRDYITTLQQQLGWSDDQLTHAAREHQIDLATLTKGQASTLIDQLKQRAEVAAPALAAQRPPPTTPADAAQRFYERYATQIGGTDWAAVQTFLHRSRQPQPTTIDGWKAIAQAVRDRAARRTA